VPEFFLGAVPAFTSSPQIKAIFSNASKVLPPVALFCGKKELLFFGAFCSIRARVRY